LEEHTGEERRPPQPRPRRFGAASRPFARSHVARRRQAVDDRTVKRASHLSHAPRLRACALLVLALAAAGCADAGGEGGGGGGTGPAEVVANGFTFGIRSAGPADGELVLLLHGFPESSLEWEALLPELARAGYHAVAPDLRGYSPGARPPDVESYRLDHLSSDVLAIADALAGDAFHVVGHDWGAAIAWNVGIVAPDRVRSLTAVSVPHPAAFARALATDPDQQQRSGYIAFFQQVGVAEQALLGNDAALLRSIYGSGAAAAHADEYVRLLGEPGALTAALNYYRALPLGGARVDDVVVPTLYVWSTGDAALGRSAAEWTADHVDGPYRFEVLEGVSHWIPEEAADELTRLLLEHLETYDRAR
jgi:pimeloyl-ACP methyl ester carboxylesterase